MLSYDGCKKVTVTSLADDGYHGEITFWVSGKQGRKKERDYNLFPVNDHNTAIIKQMDTKESEIEALNKALSDLKQKLQKATVPAEIK